MPSAPSVPVVIAAPHGGRAYPQEVTVSMRDPDYAKLRLEDRFVDQMALAIAERTGAAWLVADAPRAMIDLNRAPDDIDWGMVANAPDAGRAAKGTQRRAKNGLGLVPRRLAEHGDIWRQPLEHGELERRIAQIHAPYHERLDTMLHAVADLWGAVLLLDLHSMPPLKSRSGSGRAAEFVVGDRFGASCGHALSALALRHFDIAGRPVAHNRPYSGGYILDRHGKVARQHHALQIEVCRSAYLDSRHENTTPRMERIVHLLSGLVQTLSAEVAQIGDPSLRRHAAE
nr:N-formylglutamate amidohydrolase [Parapontixanthobacter aurantiacus]